MKFWGNFKDWFFLRFRRAKVDEFIHSTQQQYRAQHGIPEDLSGYKEKFKRNLLGKWTTSLGYAGPFSETQWRFFADGTARIDTYAHDGDERQSLFWRESGDFTIELRYLDEEDTQVHWIKVNYDFKRHNERIVLFETPEQESHKFQLTIEYLMFEGDYPS